MNTEIFNGFLLSAQQESSPEKCQEVLLDVFLMNGYRISINARTNERSEQILEVSSSKVGHQFGDGTVTIKVTVILVTVIGLYYKGHK